MAFRLLVEGELVVGLLHVCLVTLLEVLGQDDVPEAKKGETDRRQVITCD